MSDVCATTDCCASPSQAPCNQTRWPQDVYAQLNLRCTLSEHGFTADEVRAEIDQGRPVQVYFDFGTSAHVALIRGYYDGDWFEINDPQNGNGRRTYLDIQTAYGYGTWAKTYVDLRPI